MSTSVSNTAAQFRFADPECELGGVSLAHELTRPRIVPFDQNGSGWQLRLPRPPVDRLEYKLVLEHRDGREEWITDPANEHDAPGPFGAKSVVEFPGYEPPAWVADEDSDRGELRKVTLPRLSVPAFLWSAVDSDPAEPLPLLVVHDGPEYAEYSSLLRLLDHLVAFGELPPFRAALLPPGPDRHELYSASARYARRLVEDWLPRLGPVEGRPVAMGASLGALAALHAHWLRPGAFNGLFLQSGSFFRRRFDSHESPFPRFGRITRFVSTVSGGRGAPDRIPVTITCGTGEENLGNNRFLAGVLDRDGWPVKLVEHPDAHNWISWRDSLHPHLADLIARAA
jgi:enterochelin esterase-like enzyme